MTDSVQTLYKHHDGGIKSLKVRGAPALGAAGAYGIALVAGLCRAATSSEMMAELETAAEMIRSARPTAVNLSWGVDRAMRAAACGESLEEIRDRALAEAEEIASEDIRINQLLGKFGARLLRDGPAKMERAIFEYMAEMAVAMLRADFGADHPVRDIAVLGNMRRDQREGQQ